MMEISDNILSAFFGGVSTLQEEITVFNEITADDSLSDVFDVVIDLNTNVDMSELKEEFNRKIDNFDNLNDHKIKVR